MALLSVYPVNEVRARPKKPSTPALLEMVTPTTRDLVTIENLRKVMEEDRRHITRHPILKHLFQRYDAILNQVTQFGNPKSPVEPIQEFKERINEQIVSHHNKKVMIEKKRARREAIKASSKKVKTKGVKYFQNTVRGNRGN